VTGLFKPIHPCRLLASSPYQSPVVKGKLVKVTAPKLMWIKTVGGRNSSGFLISMGREGSRTYQPSRVSLAISDAIRSGRGIRRLVTLCGTIRQLVKENDRRLLGSDADSDDDDEELEASQPPQDPLELAQR
jgi:hypothetical protein